MDVGFSGTGKTAVTTMETVEEIERATIITSCDVYRDAAEEAPARGNATRRLRREVGRPVTEALLEESTPIRERGIAFNPEGRLSGFVGVGALVAGEKTALVGAVSNIDQWRRLRGRETHRGYPRRLERRADVLKLDLLFAPRHSREGVNPGD